MFCRLFPVGEGGRGGAGAGARALLHALVFVWQLFWASDEVDREGRSFVVVGAIGGCCLVSSRTGETVFVCFVLLDIAIGLVGGASLSGEGGGELFLCGG